MTELFANQRQINLTSTIQLIEQALRGLGHDPAACRLEALEDEEAAWQFRHGSALTRIQLAKDQGRGQGAFLRVASILLTLDAAVDRLALYTHLLALNRKLHGLTLAVDDDRVELAAERPSRDLDRSEVDDLLTRVSRRADELDDQLIARFGGLRGAAHVP
jgi:site-specific recombinase